MIVKNPPDSTSASVSEMIFRVLLANQSYRGALFETLQVSVDVHRKAEALREFCSLKLLHRGTMLNVMQLEILDQVVHTTDWIEVAVELENRLLPLFTEKIVTPSSDESTQLDSSDTQVCDSRRGKGIIHL